MSIYARFCIVVLVKCPTLHLLQFHAGSDARGQKALQKNPQTLKNSVSVTVCHILRTFYYPVLNTYFMLSFILAI